VVPGLLAMLESPVAALRAKALVSFALLTQTHSALLLAAFQLKLSPQVCWHVLQHNLKPGTHLMWVCYSPDKPKTEHRCNAWLPFAKWAYRDRQRRILICQPQNLSG